MKYLINFLSAMILNIISDFDSIFKSLAGRSSWTVVIVIVVAIGVVIMFFMPMFMSCLVMAVASCVGDSG